MPSHLEIRDTKCSILPAFQKKNFDLWSFSHNPNEDRHTRHSNVPKLDSLTWPLIHCLIQSEPGPPDQNRDS